MMSVPGTSHADVAAQYHNVRAELHAAALTAGRAVTDVTVLAVSKTHPPERIVPLLDLGHRQFAENRVQEAQQKWPALKAACPDVVLHLIGPLQTNKLAAALALFDVIQTLDRPRLAEALAAAQDRGTRCPPCYIQVNTGAEPQKAGVLPEQADAFIADCRDRLGLPVIGLMCIPPAEEDPAPHFAALAALAQRHGLPRLSMGMSGDFPAAIAAGATDIRVGTAIFGHRPPLLPPGQGAP